MIKAGIDEAIYESNKIICRQIDELITHNIFYTAITRARKFLKIYWTQPVEEKVLKQIKPHDNRNDVALLKQEIGSIEFE